MTVADKLVALIFLPTLASADVPLGSYVVKDGGPEMVLPSPLSPRGACGAKVAAYLATNVRSIRSILVTTDTVGLDIGSKKPVLADRVFASQAQRFAFWDWPNASFVVVITIAHGVRVTFEIIKYDGASLYEHATTSCHERWRGSAERKVVSSISTF